ncbi:MAG: SemiSWEET transporter [Ferruginibacter sp.]
MQSIEILGLAAGTITSITFVPQVIKIWQTKSAKDLSLFMLLLLLVGTSMWLAYGIFLGSIAIIYTNSMVTAMGLLMLYFKFRFK